MNKRTEGVRMLLAVSALFAAQAFASDLNRTGTDGVPQAECRRATMDVDLDQAGTVQLPFQRVTDSMTTRRLGMESGLAGGLDELDNVAFLEDFEGDFPGVWTITGGPSTWGLRTERHHGGSAAIWCNGSNREPGQGYRPSTVGVIWVQLDLSGYEAATVSFWHWTATQNGQDNLFAGVSPGGSPFDGVLVYGLYSEWRRVTFDISEYTGDTITLVFRFQSNASVEYEGVWIDDIVIDAVPAGTPDLKITGITHNPENPQPGQAVDVGVTVLNYGDVNSGTFYVDLFQDQPVPPLLGDYGEQYQFVQNGINANTQQIFHFDVYYGSNGTKHLWSIVDTDQLVEEFNELDNIFGIHDLPSGVATVVDAVPQHQFIILPPSGGSFNYTITIDQYTAQATYEAWTAITYLPYGSSLQVEFFPSVTFDPEIPLVMPRSQAVPGGAPPGDYQLTVAVGTYPWIIHDAGTFFFTKIGGMNGMVADLGDPAGWVSHASEAIDDRRGVITALEIPEHFTMGPAYPNPFNATAALLITLPWATTLEVTACNLQGREVATLASGPRSAGVHKLVFDGGNLASGVYLLRAVTSDGGQQVQKVMLLH